jgi:hypothetical protein
MNGSYLFVWFCREKGKKVIRGLALPSQSNAYRHGTDVLGIWTVSGLELLVNLQSDRFLPFHRNPIQSFHLDVCNFLPTSQSAALFAEKM